MRPKREPATSNRQTYMVTSETWGRRSLFRAEPWARLFIDTLYHYRGSGYLLHEFVVMPDHFHALITPTGALERAVQFIKGGFSFRAKKELGSNMEAWQVGFADHRVRDAADYQVHVAYIHMNPVRKHLVESAQEYPYSSAHPGFVLDDIPQGLKPLSGMASDGGPKGPPFQESQEHEQTGTAEPAPVKTKHAQAH
jgi:putative transposase